VTHDLDSAIAATASKITYTGASTSAVAWVFSSEFGILFGVLIGLGGFVVNLYYKRKQDKREQDEHDKKMNSL
jgi:hypothetical protein